eukprot:Nk52_evm30s249 gene=Nk52_evmTU30s249
MADIQTIIGACAANQWATAYPKLGEEGMLTVWNCLCNTVKSNLLSGKGTKIPGLGTVFFSKTSLRRGVIGDIVQLVPNFHLNSDFRQTYFRLPADRGSAGKLNSESACAISDINFAKIWTICGINREYCKSALEEILYSLGLFASQPSSKLKIKMGELGTLYISNKKAEMLFAVSVNESLQDLVNSNSEIPVMRKDNSDVVPKKASKNMIKSKWLATASLEGPTEATKDAPMSVSLSKLSRPSSKQEERMSVEPISSPRPDSKMSSSSAKGSKKGSAPSSSQRSKNTSPNNNTSSPNNNNPFTSSERPRSEGGSRPSSKRCSRQGSRPSSQPGSRKSKSKSSSPSNEITKEDILSICSRKSLTPREAFEKPASPAVSEESFGYLSRTPPPRQQYLSKDKDPQKKRELAASIKADMEALEADNQAKWLRNRAMNEEVAKFNLAIALEKQEKEKQRANATGPSEVSLPIDRGLESPTTTFRKWNERRAAYCEALNNQIEFKKSVGKKEQELEDIKAIQNRQLFQQQIEEEEKRMKEAIAKSKRLQYKALSAQVSLKEKLSKRRREQELKDFLENPNPMYILPNRVSDDDPVLKQRQQHALLTNQVDMALKKREAVQKQREEQMRKDFDCLERVRLEMIAEEKEAMMDKIKRRKELEETWACQIKKRNQYRL